ncbi:MAG TPA: helix-turn-helix transcriptional regulator [Solirubrobacterales bacterium]|nr:helix-turn-helix transcriptional regulator [Solirubrobacterales bacterium]
MVGPGNKRRPGEGSEGGPHGLDRRRGVFMISVAAELAEMHPQTLRMYEARGLITPKRSPKNTRLYSYEDVERLRRIQEMTADEGLNLAGVETVLNLERELERARGEMKRMRERATELERQMDAELERVRRSLRAEIVPYGAYDQALPKPPGQEGDGERVQRSVSIPIERARRRRGESPGRESR